MTEPTKSKIPETKTKDRIIVALDVETARQASEIIDEIGGEAGAFKIGLQLFTSAGASFVRETVERGIRIFLDLKFHDIPNTVAKASVEAARLGVWMFNLHASGGSEMMRTAVGSVTEFCDKENLQKPLIIGVTVLTSSNADTLTELGLNPDVNRQVLNLAKLTANCGLDGVVASAHETPLIRQAIENKGFSIVTPGIRTGFATNDDQKRVMTAREAVSNGSSYLVIGRPILQAKDKLKAVKSILAEIEN
ncbi:MAG: orotidine 5-phosphate decarboxylase [Acidobacteria bacterium]|jgi:orotidine-5'-phosphate decarboxylase|nr:orotidine 5-phosphate decarboxylase [Acidobacteriota bacterium]